MIFYEIKVKYQRQTGEDNPGNVKESYLIEGLNCSDVEARMMEIIKPYVFGDLEVTGCTKKQFFEIINNPEGDRWYKGRVELITIEDNGKETRKTVSVLVEASSIAEAQKTLSHAMNSYDCEIISIAKTPFLEVHRAIHTND